MNQSENVTPIDINQADTATSDDGAAIRERVRQIIGPSFEQLAHYLETGEGDPRSEIIQDALLLTDALSEDPDGIHRDTMWLLHRILLIGKSIQEYEADRRDAQRKAKREREEAEREAWNNSPAAKVDVVGFMAGINSRSRVHIAKVLDELEAECPKAAEIATTMIRSEGDVRLFINPDDPERVGAEIFAEKHGVPGLNLVVLGRIDTPLVRESDEWDAESVECWMADDVTVEALRPLAQEGSDHE